jgi:hypothetical protein
MIEGDVKLEVSIRPDGNVESVRVISGHPMLVHGAIESAKQSRYVCRACTGVVGYVITYTFTLRRQLDRCCCSEKTVGTTKSALQDDALPHVTEGAGHVTVSGPPVCLCPEECTLARAEEQSYSRSAKCLYLWKCGYRTIGIQ